MKEHFPFFSTNTQITYLDSACTTLIEQSAFDAQKAYAYNYPVCAGRSAHTLSTELAKKIQDARNTIKAFFDAKDYELIFTKNTTEVLNIIAKSFIGKTVAIGECEHNSNLVPYLSQNTKPVIVSYKDLMQAQLPKADLYSFAASSNVTGIPIPYKELAKKAHAHKGLMCLDACQISAHSPLLLASADIDFCAISGHKMYGPHCGILLVKKKLLSGLTALCSGGMTVTDTTYTTFESQNDHQRFEAGIQDYPALLGLAKACEFIKKKGFSAIQAHEKMLMKTLTDELASVWDTFIHITPQDPKELHSIFSFLPKGWDAHEFSQLLDKTYDIATRSGMHCAHSYFHARKLPACVRISIGMYNTKEDMLKVAKAIKELIL